MNSVSLTGRLTKDPEVRYSQAQMAIASFTLAVDRPYSKDRENSADFIRITTFGKQAEFVEKYLTKGRLIGVTGRIQTGSYQDKDGNTRYTTDVIADRIEFLGSQNRDNNGNFEGSAVKAAPATKPQMPSAAAPEGFSSLDDDDIPF